MAKLSFKKGTLNRAASHKMAESLKDKYGEEGAFAVATAATKRMSEAGKKRMARNGQKSPAMARNGQKKGK